MLGLNGKLMRFATLTLVSLIGLVGCSTPNKVTSGKHPADGSVNVPPLHYQSVTSGTKKFRPVGPKNWIDLNSEVAPKKK